MTRPPSSASALTGFDLSLYAAVVFLWGTSWIALHWQLGVVAPEVSLTWRFAIAATLMMIWAKLSGTRLSYPPRLHLYFAVQGLTLFCLNFVMFYHAGLALPSGLLAVIFSLASVVNLFLQRLVFAEALSVKMMAGGILGFIGVALMMEPQIVGTTFNHNAGIGLLLGALGTVSFCAGGLISQRLKREDIPLIGSTAWGMTYGVIFLVLIALALGRRFEIEPTALYVSSLVWLAVLASCCAFMAYLTLLARIGAARASYSTVLYPVVALAISTVFEGYTWPALAVLGLAFVIVGNIIVLRR